MPAKPRPKKPSASTGAKPPTANAYRMIQHQKSLQSEAERKAKRSLLKKVEYANQTPIPHYTAFAKMTPNFVDEAKRKYYLTTYSNFAAELKAMEPQMDSSKAEIMMFVLLPISETKQTHGELDFPDVSRGYIVVRPYVGTFNVAATAAAAAAAAAPAAAASGDLIIDVMKTDFRRNRAVGMIIAGGKFRPAPVHLAKLLRAQ